MWVSALAIAMALAVGVSEVGVTAVEQARAQTAADAAALAGAADGRAAARQTAQRNDAILEVLTVDGHITTVVVTYGRARATATAERLLIPIEQ